MLSSPKQGRQHVILKLRKLAFGACAASWSCCVSLPKGEGGEFEGGLALSHCPFREAITEGTVDLVQLTRGPGFGSIWGSPRDLSGGAPRGSVSCVTILLYYSFGAAGVLHWGHSNASFPNATHRLAGHAAARRKPSARPPLVGASNHVKRCLADHRSATDTLRTLSSLR